jgi:tetratricopeptide (TPR) repeat protein
VAKMLRIAFFLSSLMLIAGTQIEDVLRRGNAAYERGDFDKAAGAYLEVEARTTDPGLVAYDKAAALYQKGQIRDAERAYRCALEDATGVRRACALYGLATALVRQSPERGAEVLRDAIRSYDSCLREPDVGAELAEDARHNLELAKILITLIPPKSSDKPDNQRDEKEEQPKPPPEPRTSPESGLEQSGQGKADARGEKQRVRKDQAKDARQTDEGSSGAGRELPPVPDQEDPAPMSPEDAHEHLKRAAARVLGEQREHKSKRRMRGNVETGLDW